MASAWLASTRAVFPTNILLQNAPSVYRKPPHVQLVELCDVNTVFSRRKCTRFFLTHVPSVCSAPAVGWTNNGVAGWLPSDIQLNIYLRNMP